MPPSNFYGLAPPPLPPQPSLKGFSNSLIDPWLLDTTSSTGSDMLMTSVSVTSDGARPPPSTIMDATNASNIPSNIATKAASSPPTFKPVKSKARKPRAEFSTHDLNQLLRAIGSHWKEVTNRVQAAGYCLGRDHETLKNKVMTLLSWVEGGKAKKTHSPLGHKAEENKETKEANKAQRAKVQEHDKAIGENMRLEMMHGMHLRSFTMSVMHSSPEEVSQDPSKLLYKRSSAESTSNTSDKENDSEAGVSSRRQAKRARIAKPATHRDAKAEFTKIVGYLEKQEGIQAEGLQEQRRANDINECTSAALIDILHTFVQSTAS
ncbi:hypothetical protein K439DRAFT_1614078 [Ramaria rubella]|nr:hypothetical protein K439DRAFT_1614078 [Ramaria rubella]